jgi:hypothetical protein
MALSTPRIVRLPRPVVNDALVAGGALVSAAAAGIHAGLVPEHLRMEPLLGVAFVIDALLLACAAAAVSSRPPRAGRLAAAGSLLAGTALAYLLSRTTGLPPVSPSPEPVDGLGLFTTVTEVAGAVCLLAASRREP